MYKKIVLITMLLVAMVAFLACSDFTENTLATEENTVKPMVSEEASKSSSDEVNKIRTVEDLHQLYEGITCKEIMSLIGRENFITMPVTMSSIHYVWRLEDGYNIEAFFEEKKAYKVIVRGTDGTEEVLFDTSSNK